MTETTTTQDGAVVEYDRHTEWRDKTQEEMEMPIKADIFHCDAMCLIDCARYVNFKAMPVKR